MHLDNYYGLIGLFVKNKQLCLCLISRLYLGAIQVLRNVNFLEIGPPPTPS